LRKLEWKDEYSTMTEAMLNLLPLESLSFLSCKGRLLPTPPMSEFSPILKLRYIESYPIYEKRFKRMACQKLLESGLEPNEILQLDFTSVSDIVPTSQFIK
jgi:hypothetical protein